MAKFITIVSGIPRLRDVTPTLPTVYDEQYDVVSTISAGVSVSLPLSGTYSGDELDIYLNGQKLYHAEDYVYVGTIPRTQVQFTFDLVAGDKVLFRKVRDI